MKNILFSNSIFTSINKNFLLFLIFTALIEIRVHALESPSDFTLSALSTYSIQLNWLGHNSDESGYRVLDGNDNPVSPDLHINTTFYVESGLNSNTQYTRKVQSFQSGSTRSSAPKSVYTLTHIPSGIESFSKKDKSIVLSWTSADSLNPNTKYILERSTSPLGTFITLVGSDLNFKSTLYMDDGLSPQTTYFYRLAGLNGDNLLTNFSAPVGIKTKGSAYFGILNLTANSKSDRTVVLSWGALTDDSVHQIEINRTDSFNNKKTYLVSASSDLFVDSDFSKTVSSFTAYHYSVTAINSDNDYSGGPSTAIITPSVLYQYIDTDADGKLEIWDVVNSTYSDSSKPINSSNRLIHSFFAGQTRVLLIDIYQRSSVPVPADFDSYPDVVWLPELGITNHPQVNDFDDDGLLDLGIDLNNDGTPDGALTKGAFKQFGTLQVSVLDQTGYPLSGALVTFVSNQMVQSRKTNSSGLVTFTLIPASGNKGTLKVESTRYVTTVLNVDINQWDSNILSVPMAPFSATSNSLNPKNYPNPVISGGTIKTLFNINLGGWVQFDLYDFSWTLVRRILDENRPAGENLVQFLAIDDSGRDLERGLYYGVLRYAGEKKVIKIVVK